MEAILKNAEHFIADILDLHPSANLKSILDDLNPFASSIGSKICKDAAASEKNSFFASITTVNKRLKAIKPKLKRQQLIEMSSMESLQKNLKDLQNISYRYNLLTGKGIKATSLIKNLDACRFWTTSFGEVVEVDWDEWISAYKSSIGAEAFNADEESILKECIGHACGRFVSAGRIDDACRAFGFPFQKLKSCQEMECLCMKFQAPLFCESRGAEYASTCNACGHDEKRHFKVENVREQRSRSGTGSVAMKAHLIEQNRAFTSTRLQRFILSNDANAVKTNLKDVADINEINQDGETALHTAAGYCNNPEIILLLLSEGASWNAMDKNGCAPVHLAARRGQLSAVKVLVEWDKANADLPSGEKSEGKRPLHFACEEDRLEVIDYLSNEAKADINSTSQEGENCLFTGALYDSSKAVKKAIEMGADPTMRNEEDEAPMDVSARHASNDTILVIACQNSDTVTAEDDEGSEPLSRCTDGTSVELLAKFGAAVDHQNHEGKSALHLSCADPSLAEVTKELLDRGANPNLKDQDGCTPLHVAARMENERAIDLLCARNADVSAADKEGNTPLLVALDKQYRTIAEKLVSIGAKATGSNRDGLTPLHLSCKNGYSRLTKNLIDSGAKTEINQKDREGKTPLHFAVLSATISLARDLLDFGANMYARDGNGDTPLGLSLRNKNPLKKLTPEEIEVLEFTEMAKDDLMTPPGPTCSQKSFADGPGLAGRHVRCRYTFTVFACDKKGRLRSVGGDTVRIKARSLTGDKETSSSFVVGDAENGTYPVVYEISSDGRYELHIMIDDEPIMGSPYVVNLLKTAAPLPPAIKTVCYSPSEYSDEEVSFALSEGIGEVDLAIVCDTTSSMSREIAKARALIKELIKAIKDEKLCTDLRIAIIAYRDHPPEDSTYVAKVFQQLSSNEDAVISAIESLEAKGGGDCPEAVADALFEVSRLNWDEAKRPHAARLAVLIGDAPPHGIEGAIYKDAFPQGCPDGHDWSVLSETCRSMNIAVFTVACRTNVFTQRAFSAIAASSGGQCTKIEKSDQIIDLIKMHVQLLLDRRLVYCKISDTIIRLPLSGTTEKRKEKVTYNMANKGTAVRSLMTSEGEASLKTHGLTAEDVESAIKIFKILDRLAGTFRDRALTDWLGKQLYALKKITNEAT